MANATDFPQGYLEATFYNGNNITCYPSSNATDDGKLNLEFNMARLVTRLSSKNFCIINPSFELTPHTDSDTDTIDGITVGVGQCSINGMDLIMNEELFITTPPETDKDYELVFKLWRDSSDNVLGDFTEGILKEFRGVYLAYCEEKDETDKDALYLGKVNWNGTDFTTLEEDEDKYGRIWANDILCKLLDPKHPDLRRPTLQEWLYNVPDWYFSKEGDNLYGPLNIFDNRESSKPGILINVTEDETSMIIKNPNSDNSNLLIFGDLNQDGDITSADVTLLEDYINGTGTLTDLQQILADVNGDGVIDEKDLEYIQRYITPIEGYSHGKTGEIYHISSTQYGITYNIDEDRTSIKLANSEWYADEVDNYLTHFDSSVDMKIHSLDELYLQGDDGVSIGAGGNGDGPNIYLNEHKATFTDNNSIDLKFEVEMVDDVIIKQTLGKAIWQYNSSTQYVSLLNNNVSLLDIQPNTLFESNARIVNTLTFGPSNSTTTLNQNQWQINDTNVMTGSSDVITHTNANILLRNTANNPSGLVSLNVNGSQELRNNASNANTTARILFGQNNTTANTDILLKKLNNIKGLDLNGRLDVVTLNASGEITGNGLTTGNGILTFVNGSNNATITKNSNSASLYTSDNLYIGVTGNKDLYVNNITANNNVSVTGNYTSTNGNITLTNGTVTANKVYGAVYQHFGETYEKSSEEIIEDGDLVIIGKDGKVTKPRLMNECKNVIGVCSDNPGFLLGSELFTPETRCAVGILGKVYVKTYQEFLTYGDKVKATVNGAEKVSDVVKDLEFIIGTVIEPYKDGKVRINFNKMV